MDGFPDMGNWTLAYARDIEKNDIVFDIYGRDYFRPSETKGMYVSDIHEPTQFYVNIGFRTIEKKILYFEIPKTSLVLIHKRTRRRNRIRSSWAEMCLAI